MADQFDQAQRIDELMRDSARAAQQKQAARTPPAVPTGECLNPLCGEPVGPPKLFCNSGCAAQHAKFQK